MLGDTNSPSFPPELRPYTRPAGPVDPAGFRVNMLVNYGWEWDLGGAGPANGAGGRHRGLRFRSHSVSRIDLVARWGGRRRLSGFLPAHSVYVDFFVLDALWPDFCEEHFEDALRWYAAQDVTRGG